MLTRPCLRVLDVGSGDGRLINLVKLARPEADVVALDFSATMLERLHARFAADSRVSVLGHELDDPLPPSLGTFDAVVSSFAIPHVIDQRKQALYGEVYHLRFLTTTDVPSVLHERREQVPACPHSSRGRPCHGAVVEFCR